MRKGKDSATLTDAISQAQEELDTLSDEMREAFDATPEHFKDSHKSREDAADYLRVAHDILLNYNDVSKAFRDEEVEWRIMCAGKNGKLYRPARRDNIVRCLEACVVRPGSLPQDGDIAKLKREWERAINVLRGVHFPGMNAG
ncbi:MAG: hypothetical protein ABSC37_11130 [Xanthobacteraceae bacterium]|jgi:hypothetical protein